MTFNQLCTCYSICMRMIGDANFSAEECRLYNHEDLPADRNCRLCKNLEEDDELDS
jgi:hypothetical protein